MTPKRRSLMRLCVLCLLLCLSLCLAACNGEETTNPTDGSAAQQVTYTVELKTQGGSPLSDITVYIYGDDTLTDLVAFAKTDKAGLATFTYNAGDSYVAVLVDVPEGYIVEKSYPITGEMTQITLETEMVQGDLETDIYQLGDVMKDFTFTAADGTEYKLSQLLQEKKMVMLNFWFLNCAPCRTEFPYLQEAYTEYADVVEVLAMNPVDGDNAKITELAQELGLTFPMGSCEATWGTAMKLSAYPTTVVIDRFGTIAMVHTGTVPDAQLFKDVFEFFAAEDYTQTVVEDMSQLATTEPEEGTAATPTEISGLSSFQLTIPAGKTHYVNIHKMQNVWLQVNNSDIYVEYAGKKYTPSGGSLGLLVSAPSTFQPAILIFGNSGSQEITVTVTLANLAGSYDNPYTLQIGEFSASVSAGNNQGVYFTYTAAEDGHFSLQCLNVSPNVAYDFSVMNLTTSAMRNMSSDGVADSETGNQTVTVAMNAGEQLRITISALPDDSNTYPAATFRMLAKFTAGDVEDVVKKEKLAYAVTVTDETRQPISGVNISLTGTEGEKITLVTDEKGVASGWFNEDVYAGTMVIPKGYKATTTAFELTPEIPMVSLKLDTVVIEYADYVVRVIDEDGNGVAGVLVTIGTTYGTTDENGVYTVNLVKGAYTAVIGVPEGYASDALSYSFPENGTTLGITLREDTSGSQTGIVYTVQVVDAGGKGMADVLVTFNQNGNPISMAPTNADGVATATLPAGDYKVSLTSASGAVLGHEDSQAILSAEKTSTVITVATDVGGDNFESAYWGNYYKLLVGSSKVDLTDTVNINMDFEVWMYVFYPSSSGIYRFAVSEGAVLGYYGGISFPNGPSRTTDEGYFEITIKDGEFANGNLPSYVLGVKPAAGQEYATVTITRVADAPAELPVTVYEPTTTLKPFTMTQSGSLTYVDLTKKVTIVKKSDGYYYNNKKLYVNLSNSAPYLTFNQMLGLNYSGGEWTDAATGTGMKGLIYEDGIVVGIEDFTQCMRDYIRASDPVTGLYPVTDDLIYMIQSAGAYMGWWNIESPNYLFSTVENLNTDTAWMFACCYVN